MSRMPCTPHPSAQVRGADCQSPVNGAALPAGGAGRLPRKPACRSPSPAPDEQPFLWA